MYSILFMKMIYLFNEQNFQHHMLNSLSHIIGSSDRAVGPGEFLKYLMAGALFELFDFIILLITQCNNSSFQGNRR